MAFGFRAACCCVWPRVTFASDYWSNGKRRSRKNSFWESENALLEGAQARVLADPELQPESLTRRITEAAAIPGEGEPGEALTRLAG